MADTPSTASDSGSRPGQGAATPPGTRHQPPRDRAASGAQRSRRAVLTPIAIVLVLLITVPLAIVHAVLAASLPKLDGTIDSPGLTAPVTVARDALGVATIDAGNRLDLAYGTGFAHAQDRFFQMDLSRRLAAGELAELFGKVALERDESARLFRFRAVARDVLAQTPPEHRAIIDAYVRGVNAGLASLRSRPWEYWVLGLRPAAWRDEDTVLVSYAMWWDLQYASLRREMMKRAINARLGGAECANGWKCALAFFYPRGTSWDSPNSANGAAAPRPPIRVPTKEELDVRDQVGSPVLGANFPSRDPAAGSNGWAVAGSLTATGAALVVSDMHLTLRVPATWYHARLRIRAADTAASVLDLNGLTLPGTPVLVAGSNGHIAWAFTNSYGDWSDVAMVPCRAVGGVSLRSPEQEELPLSVVRETIHVKDASDVELVIKSGAAGVLFDAQPGQGRCWFVRWLATLPAATNLNLLALETANSTAQALALAPSIGIPHQNFMVGDRDGHIGWSVLGRIPEASGAKRLTGEVPWTTQQSHPRLLDPPVGRVWTANARPIDDSRMEAEIGGDEAELGADYDLGARAHQIRDDLFALQGRATPADMLRVQLDDRAAFLTRWRGMLVGLLDEEAVRGHPKRAAFKRIVAEWRARASADSVGYRLVRAYRTRTDNAVWQMLLRAMEIDAPDAPAPAQFEGPLWQLVTTQPMHLLAAAFPSWREFLLEQLDATISDLEAHCPQLSRCTWGERRPVSIQHSLSGALPFAAALLDMPTLALPGDHDMPRVQDGSFGASERFAVSPGHETRGYLHIAGGQSGHPLSPYYRAGFREWAAGKPLPFLPGRTEHRLSLEPPP